MTPAIDDGPVTVYNTDVLAGLAEIEAESVQTVVTSPPYWGLRDYGTAIWEGGDAGCDHLGPPMRTNAKTTVPTLERGPTTFHGGTTRAAEPYRALCGKCGAVRIDAQLGLEATPDEYVCAMVEVFREVRRVLRKDGTLWLNMGDSYATGAGKVGNHPGGGVQGEAWKGYRGTREESPKHTNGAIGPMTQPNRMPLPGLKPKDLVGIPWRVAFALQADGWYLRSDIIWSKPNPMPESVTDRPTKAHEYLFLLTRSPRYYYDADAIREAAAYAGPNGAQHSPYGQGFTRRSQAGQDRNGQAQIKGGDRYSGFNTRWDEQVAAEGAPLARNRRTVWEIATQPYPDAHFATFPEKLVEPCIKAGSREGDLVLDPFAGSGTTLAVARRLGRRAVGIELNPEYVELIRKRVGAAALPLLEEIT